MLLALSSSQRVQILQALNISNMSIEEAKIVFTAVQRLKTSRPGHNSLRVMFQNNYEINQFALILIYYIILIEIRR